MQFIYLNTGKSVRILFIIASLLKEKTAKAPKNGFFAVNNFRHCKNLSNTKYIEKTVLLPERFIPKQGTCTFGIRIQRTSPVFHPFAVPAPKSKFPKEFFFGKQKLFSCKFHLTHYSLMNKRSIQHIKKNCKRFLIFPKIYCCFLPNFRLIK